MPTRSRLMRNKITLTVPGAPLLAVVIGFLCLMVTAEDVRAQEQAAPVRVDPVKIVPMSQTVPVIGRLVTRRAGAVAARINGPIEEFLVEVGDRVARDQVIAVLNDERLRAQLHLSEGRLKEAKALAATKRAALKLARLGAARMEGLRKSAAFSQARYDDALQAAAIAEAEVVESEASIESFSAELRLSEINLNYSEVRAPYAGVITRRLTETGAYVQIGDPVVTMVSDEDLEIEADIPFQRLSGLALGTKVRILLDDGTEHEARVRAIVPEENPLTRTRVVRFVANIGETKSPLATQQSVTVFVPAGRPRKVLTVHKDAIIKQGNENVVFTIEDGSAIRSPVRLGAAVGGRLEVLDGLSEGELVVVRGNERLRQGDQVRVNGVPQ